MSEVTLFHMYVPSCYGSSHYESTGKWEPETQLACPSEYPLPSALCPTFCIGGQVGGCHGISPCSQTTHFPHLILHQHKAFATLQLCLCKIVHSTTTTTCDWVHFCKYYLIILTPLILVPHTAAEETKVQRGARNSRSKAPVQTLDFRASACPTDLPSVSLHPSPSHHTTLTVHPASPPPLLSSH